MLAKIPSHYLIIGSTFLAIFMGMLVMFVRVRSQKKPVSERKILIPPIAMSTGALMFIFEPFRVAPVRILEAVFVGIIFSTVLIATSKFEVRNNDIYLKRSKAFFFILVGLLIIRVVAKSVMSSSIDVGELGGMFWILAFSMIWPWRLSMFIQYRKIKKMNAIS